MNRDPELYYFTVFGTPGDKTAWGWRVEGHHLSQNFTIADGTFASWTPDFYGANPAEVMQGSRKGLRVLAAEEDKAFALLRALDAAAEETAVLQDKVPGDMITTNARRVDLLAPAGLSAASMTRGAAEAAARARRRVHLAHGGRHRRRADAPHQRAGFDKVAFVVDWRRRAARAALLPVQGPTFLIEFDNVQTQRNHIHSVWRDFNGDFGDDVLKNHYQSAHNQ